jgi:hypothetical protein
MRAQRLAGIGWRKLGTVWFGVVLSGAAAQGRQPQPAAEVTVYVTGARSVPSSKYNAAKETVDGIFARVGIRMVWLDRPRPAARAAAGPVVIEMQIVGQPVGNCSPTALAHTAPFAAGAKTITVSWDRVRLFAGGPSLEPHLLAYVMAHEIAHALEVSDWHAQSGVMKASWNEQDYTAMEKGLLKFTPADVYMIREGLKSMRAQTGVQAGGVSW